MVRHRPLTADFKDPVMNMTGSRSATAFESTAHFYQEFMVYLEVIFVPRREFDLTVLLIADTVNLAGLFMMLMYMGLAFSSVYDVIPHGSH